MFLADLILEREGARQRAIAAAHVAQDRSEGRAGGGLYQADRRMDLAEADYDTATLAIEVWIYTSRQ